MASKITSENDINEYEQAINDKLKANNAKTIPAWCRYMNKHKGYQIMFDVEEVNSIYEADINAFIDNIKFMKLNTYQ